MTYSSILAQKGTLSGKVKDSISGHSMGFASVGIFNLKDSTLLNYTISSESGSYFLSGLPLNTNLIISCSFTGYKQFSNIIILSKETTQFDVTIIQNDNLLDSVVIKSFIPPVLIKKDTIEFNASAFVGMKNESVYELLKKLPGVEKDVNGNFRVNGKTVSRITIEGNDFFKDNVNMALKNLPAEFIDKVQVTTDARGKSSVLTPEDEKTQKINLKLKKEILGKPFGKTYLGVGNNDNYEAGGILNTINSNKQLSVIAFSNNLNKTGFSTTDISEIGVRNLVQQMQNAGNSIIGTILIGNNEGLQKSSGAGINYGLKRKKSLLNVNYFITDSKNISTTKSKITSYFGDTVLNNASSNIQSNNSFLHNLNANYEWKKDSIFYFSANPSFKNGLFSSDLKGESAFFSNNVLLNKSSIQTKGTSGYAMYNVISGLNIRSKKNKYNFQIGNTVSNENSNSDLQKDQIIRYYFNNSLLDTSYLRQRIDMTTQNLLIKTAIDVSYVINTKSFLTISLQENYKKNQETRSTFEFDSLIGGIKKNTDLSYRGEVIQSNFVTSVLYKYLLTKTIGFTGILANNTINQQSLFSKSSKIALRTSYNFLLPKITFSVGRFNLNYEKRVELPTMSNLNPFVDSTSRLFLKKGNIDLTPVLTNSMTLNYFSYNTKTKTNFNLFSSINFVENPITANIFVNGSGKTISEIVNAGNSFSSTVSVSLSKQVLKKNATSIISRVTIGANYGKSNILFSGLSDYAHLSGYKFGINNEFSFRDNLKSSFNYQYGITKSTSDLNNSYTTNNFAVASHLFESRQAFNFSKRVMVENDITLSLFPNFNEGYRRNTFLWNASLSVFVFKKSEGQLRVSAYDILNQNIYSVNSIFSNRLTEIQSNSLNRYGLITFIYNIRPNSANKR